MLLSILLKKIISLLPDKLVDLVNVLTINELEKRKLLVDLVCAYVSYEAKIWLKECEFPDITPDEIDNLSFEDIASAIENHYDGGFSNFLKSIIY